MAFSMNIYKCELDFLICCCIVYFLGVSSHSINVKEKRVMPRRNKKKRKERYKKKKVNEFSQFEP